MSPFSLGHYFFFLKEDWQSEDLHDNQKWPLRRTGYSSRLAFSHKLKYGAPLGIVWVLSLKNLISGKKKLTGKNQSAGPIELPGKNKLWLLGHEVTFSKFDKWELYQVNSVYCFMIFITFQDPWKSTSFYLLLANGRRGESQLVQARHDIPEFPFHTTL